MPLSGPAPSECDTARLTYGTAAWLVCVGQRRYGAPPIGGCSTRQRATEAGKGPQAVHAGEAVPGFMGFNSNWN